MEMRTADSAEQAVQRGIPAQETVAKIAKRLIMSVAALEDRVATSELFAAQATPIDRKQRSLAESKCIGNLKTLGSDKAEFKVWNDKFINAVAQTLGAPWRKYMRNLNRKLDQDRKPLTSDVLGKI